ncbi:MAG: ABC transporter permease [Betaproteobacteria bacterium]|nr:ABC transporter permease [Betaproteobacteria bacterium]
MFRYYFLLGVRNLRRNPALTALMVLTLAIGVAASISTLTILHVMSGDPIPHKSQRLLVPLIDNGPSRGYVPGAKPNDNQMSYRDAVNLTASGQGERRTAVYGVAGAIEAARPDLPVEDANGLAVENQYFAMFETPFLYGAGWSEAEDKGKTKVVVLSRKKSEKLFGAENPVGKRMRMMNEDFQIIGVLDKWNPLPRYTHLINGNGGSLSGEDEMFIPFSVAIALQLSPNGNTTCQGDSNPGFQGFLDSECTWIQYWFETKNVADRAALKDYLNSYMSEQRKLGRFQRQQPAQLFNVMEWMNWLEIVSNDTRLSVWLSFGFLLLCLVNTVGLLLAKFSVRAPEVGVRRALGATQGDIFRQFLVEAGVIGIAGGITGLLVALGSLALIAKQSKDLAVVAHMDWSMLALTIVMALVASLLAGLLPTWRACQVTPAIQLKSQ